MRGFFSIDGPFSRGMTFLWKLMVINACVLMFSLPIVTIGAAQTAGFSCLIALAEQRDGAIWATFYDSFKKNFLASTILWGFLGLGGYLLLVIWRYAFVTNDFGWWTIGAAIVTVLYLNLCQYIFFYLARFEGDLKMVLKNSTLTFGFAPGRSIVLILWMCLPVLLSLYSPFWLIAVLYTSLFVLISAIMWIRTKVMLPLFDQLQNNK